MAEYGLNLRDYLRIFRKRKFIIILSFFSVTAVSALVIQRQPITYQSSTTIKIEERKTIAGLLTEEIVFNPADLMESETKIIKGYPVMKKVALRLKKIEPTSSLEEVNNVVSQLQGNIETERLGDTNIIKISATAGEPGEAMALANATAEVYIEESHLEKAKQARHARQFIEEQLLVLQDRLRQIEEDLLAFNNEVRSIRLADPIQQKLVQLQFQLAELLQKYTEKHPTVLQFKGQIKNLEEQLKGFSAQELEYGRLAREDEVNKKLYALLKEKLEEARISEAQKVSDVSIVDPAIMPDAPISGNNKLGVLVGAILGLILGCTLAFVAENLDTSIGTIEDVEGVLKLPVLGVVPSVEEELKKLSVFAKFKERIIPTPKTEAEEDKIRLFSHYKPHSSVAEAYRHIQTNLKIFSSCKTILVTSSNPQEGKSGVVTNLGIVMAQAGLKVLLVASDLRRPVISRTFGIKPEPGLYEFLTGAASIEQVIKNITDIMVGELNFEELLKTPSIENISIIPSGRFTPNPVELLESKQISNLLELLRSRFEVVIFDSPPVLSVTDASILAPKMDAVVIVYEIGRTSRDALIRTKVQLESLGAKIAGVVLNHTRLQAPHLTPYPYYKYKDKYYRQEGEEKRGTR